MLLCGTAIRGRKLHQLILQGDQPEGWSFWHGGFWHGGFWGGGFWHGGFWREAGFGEAGYFGKVHLAGARHW